MASSGNFCTLNPLHAQGGGTPDFGTLSNGNLSVSLTDTAFGNFGVTSGKWYWEYRMVSSATSGSAIGWANERVNSQPELGYNSPSSPSGAQIVYVYLDNNPMQIISDAPKSSSSGGNLSANAISQNDIIGVAADFDNNKWYFSINGSFTDMLSGQNPSDGSNPTCSASGGGGVVTIARTAGLTWFPAIGSWAAPTRDYTVNFGQDSTFGGAITAGGESDGNGFGDFKYSVPTGFLALCSANLPISDDIDPAQTDDNYPGKQFGVAAYSGNSSTQSIDLGFKPDLIWTKIRVASDSRIVDSTRGTDSYLISNTSAAESTVSTGVTAFTTTGYNLGSDGIYNGSSYTYVSWNWRCNGGSTSSNSDGDITSTVQANQEAGFSIMKWTGNGSSNQTIGHGLGAVPDIWMVKNIDSSGDWRVGLNTTAGAAFNSLSGSNDALKLNGTDAAAQMWRPEGNFTATSTTCNTPNNGNSAAFFTTSGDDFIGYCWRGIEGFSKFGIYEGNNNNDGPYIYLGFRPRLVVIKNIDSAQDWIVMDTARETRNPLGEKVLAWNDDYAEFDPSTVNLDVTSSGFKIRGNDTKINSSATFIYLCWGDVPFKYNNTF